MDETGLNLSDAAKKLFTGLLDSNIEIIAAIKSKDSAPFQDMRRKFRSTLIEAGEDQWELRIRGRDAATILVMACALSGIFMFQGEKLSFNSN